MRFFFALGLGLGLAAATLAQAGGTWIEASWPQALAAAHASHKPILAYFLRRGCGPCSAQDRTLAAPEVAADLENFVAVRFDLEDPIGREMARRFKVVGSPNSLFFDAQGAEQDRVLGAWPAADFVAEMKRIRSGNQTVPDLLSHAEEYAADINFNFMLGAKLADRGDPRAIQYLERVLALDPTNTHGRSDDALLASANLAARDSSDTTAASTLERLLRRFPDSDVADQAFRSLASAYQSLGQTDRAVATLERATAAKPGDPRRLNDLAWNLTQWQSDLTRALAAAEKAVALAPNDPGYLDTLAGVHSARGEYALAVQAEKRALEKAPGDRELEDRLARFEAAQRSHPAKTRNGK